MVSPDLIPDYLQKLLSIEKKSELKKFCRKITISLNDLTKLILNLSMIGFLHMREHHEYVPKHLTQSNDEIDALFDFPIGEKIIGKAEKCLNKISQTFKERRCLSLHVFFNDVKWHLIYFDQNSVQGIHWKHGPHIHFVNYLCIDINNCFDDFEKLENASLHIRYKD
jgi:hypothetical protein